MNQWEQKIIEKESGEGYFKEDIMLADYMIWLRNTYPELRKCVFHIENEGNSSSQYARFKGAQSLAKGKLAGVFDILSVYKGAMVWIELKLPKVRKVAIELLSDEQKELYALWKSWGIKIYPIDNFFDFKWVIDNIILKA